MSTERALTALAAVIRDHRRQIARGGDVLVIARAVDTLLEIEDMKLEALVRKLVKARQAQARILAGRARQRRRRAAVH